MYLNMDLDVQLKELTFKNKDLLLFKLHLDYSSVLVKVKVSFD